MNECPKCGSTQLSLIEGMVQCLGCGDTFTDERE